MATDNFTRRHIGPSENDVQEMLKATGVKSIDELIDLAIRIARDISQDGVTRGRLAQAVNRHDWE